MKDRVDESIESDENLGAHKAIAGALDLFEDLKWEAAGGRHGWRVIGTGPRSCRV
jgi:hypothetical protein